MIFPIYTFIQVYTIIQDHRVMKNLRKCIFPQRLSQSFADHVEKLLDFYPEVPKKIVEVLARTLTSLMPQITHDLENDERRLLLSLLFCLGEWVMRLPKFMLTHPQEDGKPLLYHVFASLYAASGSQFRPQKQEKVGPAVMINDFDPNIHMDNVKSEASDVEDIGFEDTEAEMRSPVR